MKADLALMETKEREIEKLKRNCSKLQKENAQLKNDMRKKAPQSVPKPTEKQR